MKKRGIFVVLTLLVLAAISIPPGLSGAAQSQTADGPDATVQFTILHTNDFHGNLQPNVASGYPGLARVASYIKATEAVSETLLLDAGDIMQGTLLSNLFKGESSIALYNYLGYDAATFGNHEFDWSQQTLISRTEEAEFPFVSSNIVINNTGDCATAGWTSPTFTTPWITKTVGTAPNTAIIGILGVTTQETPYITLAGNTAGLCFKDPANSISHYYQEVLNAGADMLVVLSHIGYTDGGYGYGFPVYGDQTLAARLNTAGTPVNLIIGGHSHTNLAAATIVGNTYVVQAHSSSRKIGRARVTINTTTHQVAIAWSRITVNMSDPQDAPTVDEINIWANNEWYKQNIGRVVGFTNVPLVRNYNGDSLMGTFVNDAVYNDLNNDAFAENDVDMVFNNPGGLRTDITFPITSTLPVTLTHGMLYDILPFGNATAVGDIQGVRLLELLNQSAMLNKGSIQVAGVRFKFYCYGTADPCTNPYAWGAYDVEVFDKATETYLPLDLNKTYRIATNEFLAPAGQDLFYAFKYVTNISYWGDMLDGVERWVNANYTRDHPYAGILDGRITRNGTFTYNPADPTQIVPVTVLHHNDSHGNTYKGAYVGYTQLATLINQYRGENPDRTLLLNAGDSIQGDAMAYFFKSAFTGFGADGSALDPSLWINPIIKEYNAMDYTAMTLGNHEFNFGNTVFAGTLGQATFPILGANITDDGTYGLAEADVKPYVFTSVPGTTGEGDIDIAVFGLANHRVPNYELPSNIEGLTFLNPLTKAAQIVPGLAAANDAVIALTHIGFTGLPGSIDVDVNVDTNLGETVSGIDAIIGGHSHTDPNPAVTDAKAYRGDYHYLPADVVNPDGDPVIINQANRYNSELGIVSLGFMPDGFGGYDLVTSAGTFIPVDLGTTIEDPIVKAIIDPYVTRMNVYNNTPIGQTEHPLDALLGFTQETNAANLQADASVWELAQHGINVDFYLAGAMTNKKVADTATPGTPYPLMVSHMFTLMPYENSLVTLDLNGPQLKTLLERGYRNYWYYKNVPNHGGYSYYTTCMLDISSGGVITYSDMFPTGYNVISLVVNGVPVDFSDAATFYHVASVNYLAAGSCNFNDNGQTLWPLDQIVHDTQYYVRDAVINYITHEGTISPVVEGRLSFLEPENFLFFPVSVR